MAKVEYSAVGRRKQAVARVRLVPGDGKVVINKRDMDNYFGLETLKMTVRQPLVLTNTTSFDVMVNVNGGGVSGQAGAIRHGISRALCKADPDMRSALKKAGFLRRDPRMKERKKYGLKAARRAPQFSLPIIPRNASAARCMASAPACPPRTAAGFLPAAVCAAASS